MDKRRFSQEQFWALKQAFHLNNRLAGKVMHSTGARRAVEITAWVMEARLIFNDRPWLLKRALRQVQELGVTRTSSLRVMRDLGLPWVPRELCPDKKFLERFLEAAFAVHIVLPLNPQL